MLKRQPDSIRYLNKNNNANERDLFSNWWREQIDHYGTSTTYYTHGYNLENHNPIYGEDPTSKYKKTENVVMLTDITNDSLMLSKFGIMADCDMTAVIHISGFYDKFGAGTEPKAGDLIQLTEYGSDRPGPRSAPIYEITERDDEYLQNTNPLIGHYVWYIKCKRFEYSYEPGAPNNINGNKQVNDVGTYGRLPEGDNPPELNESYSQNVQDINQSIYDYYVESPNKSFVYGYYGKPKFDVTDYEIYNTSNASDKFNITLLFKKDGQFIKEEKGYIKKAADYWASVLKDTVLPPQSIPDIYLHAANNEQGETVDNPLGSNYETTGMLIVLEKFSDEESNTLAYAAPSYVRNAPGEPYDQFTSVGSYVTNGPKVAGMLIPTGTEVDPPYYWVALHEMGHLLGISINNWQVKKTPTTLRRSFYVCAKPSSTPPSRDIFYSTKRHPSRTESSVFEEIVDGDVFPLAGSFYAYNQMYGPNESNAVKAYNETFGISVSAIPLENKMGSGSYGSHWYEGGNNGMYVDDRTYYGKSYPGAPALAYEIMTPVAENSGIPTPVSKITLGALEDLGWTVDYSKAHTFTPLAHTIKGTHSDIYMRICNYEQWSLVNPLTEYCYLKRGYTYKFYNQTTNGSLSLLIDSKTLDGRIDGDGAVVFDIPRTGTSTQANIKITFSATEFNIIKWKVVG